MAMLMMPSRIHRAKTWAHSLVTGRSALDGLPGCSELAAASAAQPAHGGGQQQSPRLRPKRRPVSRDGCTGRRLRLHRRSGCRALPSGPARCRRPARCRHAVPSRLDMQSAPCPFFGECTFQRDLLQQHLAAASCRSPSGSRCSERADRAAAPARWCSSAVALARTDAALGRHRRVKASGSSGATPLSFGPPNQTPCRAGRPRYAVATPRRLVASQHVGDGGADVVELLIVEIGVGQAGRQSKSRSRSKASRCC